MVNEKEFRELVKKFSEDFNEKKNLDELIDELVIKVFSSKVIKHNLIDEIIIEGEELKSFNKNPLRFLKDYDLYDLPSFSFNKGSIPDAKEGEEFFIRINGNLYSFTIHEGECVEASWSGSIYTTDFANLKLIPSEKEKNFNLKKYPENYE